MQQERRAKRLRAVVSVLVAGSAIAAPAVAAPNAMQRAQEKLALTRAQREKAAEEAKAGAARKTQEALAFNPFAASLKPAAQPRPTTNKEAARRLVERVRAFQKAAQSRTKLIMLVAQSVEKRSPNEPPPATEPRPLDSASTGANVPAGPS